MQSGDPIESQYERESRVELYVNRVIDKKYELNPTLSRLFSTFKDRRTVPSNITWEKMKREFGWGFAKGSRLDPLVTWIYLRPDIKKAISQTDLTIDTVLKSLRLNEHFFITEKKAIAFLKTHCNRIQYDAEAEDAEREAENNNPDNVFIYIYIYYL
jgi:hypothetical protein